MSKSFAEKLAEIRAKTNESLTSINNRLVERLVAAETAKRALKAGDKIPEFALPNSEGGVSRSQDLLAHGPAVISFYRGQWCPYCSAELEALHVAAPDICRQGASLAAITAEAGGLPSRIKRERNFTFDILSDLDYGVALAFGLLFRVPDDAADFFRGMNIDFPSIYDNASWFLTIPATYIVAQDGTIAHAYVNPDFRERLDPNEIVQVLSGMK